MRPSIDARFLSLPGVHTRTPDMHGEKDLFDTVTAPMVTEKIESLLTQKDFVENRLESADREQIQLRMLGGGHRQPVGDGAQPDMRVSGNIGKAGKALGKFLLNTLVGVAFMAITVAAVFGTVYGLHILHVIP